MGILKDLIDQLEEEYGRGTRNPFHYLMSGSQRPPFPSSSPRMAEFSLGPPILPISGSTPGRSRP
jgi:hypothetical protein